MKLTIRQTSLSIAAAALALFFAATTGGESENRRDGNWWASQTKEYKLTYMVGFFDGMELGHDFSYWKILQTNKSDPALSRILDAYSEYLDKYLAHVTNDQLVEGLDSFYSDYKNRRIRIEGAVWLVLNGIAGTPEDELKRMIENWRKNASQ